MWPDSAKGLLNLRHPDFKSGAQTTRLHCPDGRPVYSLSFIKCTQSNLPLYRINNDTLVLGLVLWKLSPLKVMMCEQIWRQKKNERVKGFEKSEEPCFVLFISWMWPICNYLNVGLCIALYNVYLNKDMRMNSSSVCHSNESNRAVLPYSTADQV